MTPLARPAALAAVLVLLAGCVGGGPPTAPSRTTATSAPTVLGDDQLAPLLDAIVTRTPKELPVTRLVDGLTPPTNRWYSGLVFGDDPQPVFPLPLSFALTDDGFAVGLPAVRATADTIAGGHRASVPVGLGAAGAVVSSDDPSVVVLDHVDATGALLGRTTIAQGSPFVTVAASRAGTITLPDGFVADADGLAVATIDGTRWALLTDGTLAGSTVSVTDGDTLVLWPVPEGQDADALVPYARATPTGSTVAYTVADDTVTTTLSLTTTGETAWARLPHQDPDDTCTLGTYPSIRGTLTLCAGSSMTWTTPRTPARAALDLSSLTAEEKTALATQLAADVADLPDLPADTYFGGKALQRTAMLLMVADQLGEEEASDRLASVLDEALTRWTEPQGCAVRDAFCFVHDPDGHGIVGYTPSFGSDEYNDHHFHYGYFLYAAAVMAAHDPSVVERYAPVLTLVAADIASAGNSSFPDRRTFDAWIGHSWASGTSPFGDGNNQESISEAVNAWAGLELWADAVGDDALATQAAWMLSVEAQSSADAWLEPDLSAFPGYEHGIVVLNWGGKRDYATWFSADPAAKLGILLLPMSPTSTYLAGDPERIRANVAEASVGNAEEKFADWITMYAALAGPDDRAAALASVDALGTLDDGLSRTYLLAWLYALPR